MGIGGLGALLGLGTQWGQQQQANLQWQLANTSNAGTAYSGTNTYVVSAVPVEAAPVRAKGPETALEWLDRRVAEVRLPLAA